MVKNKCLPILLAISVLAPAGLLQAVTLKDAVARALEKSHALQSQLLDQEALLAGREFALKQRIFHLDFSGGWRFASDAVEVTAGDLAFKDLLPFPLPIQDDRVLLSAARHTYDLKLGAVQPFYTGGILTNTIRLEETKQAAQEWRTRVLKLEIAGRVKTSYLAFKLLEAKARSLGTLLVTLNLHLQRVDSFFRQDLVKRSDLLETQAKVEETRLTLEDVMLLIAKERIAFETLCGLRPDEVEPGPAEEVEGHEKSLAALEQDHPLLKALDQRARGLDISRKIISGSSLPQVAGFGEVHYGRPGINFFKKEWTTFAVAGVTLTLPVFNLNRSARDRALIDVERRKLENERAEFLQAAGRLLDELYETKGSLEKKLATLDGLLALAEEDARLKARLYEESQIANLDYLAALAALEKYRSLKNECRLQWELVKVHINLAVGKMGDRP